MAVLSLSGHSAEKYTNYHEGHAPGKKCLSVYGLFFIKLIYESVTDLAEKFEVGLLKASDSL
jgi:hypothetical protein